MKKSLLTLLAVLFTVLDGKGRMIHSQNTGLLEAGEGYDKKKMLAFLRRYRAPAASPARNRAGTAAGVTQSIGVFRAEV